MAISDNLYYTYNMYTSSLEHLKYHVNYTYETSTDKSNVTIKLNSATNADLNDQLYTTDVGSAIDSIATGLNYTSDYTIDSNSANVAGGLTFNVDSGSYLVYDADSYSWKDLVTSLNTYTAIFSFSDQEFKVETKEKDTIEVKNDGVYINGKKETNASKIGLAFLRYSESLKDDNINSVEDL